MDVTLHKRRHFADIIKGPDTDTLSCIFHWDLKITSSLTNGKQKEVLGHKEDENYVGGMRQEPQDCQKHLLAGGVTKMDFPWKPQKELNLLIT